MLKVRARAELDILGRRPRSSRAASSTIPARQHDVRRPRRRVSALAQLYQAARPESAAARDRAVLLPAGARARATSPTRARRPGSRPCSGSPEARRRWVSDSSFDGTSRKIGRLAAAELLGAKASRARSPGGRLSTSTSRCSTRWVAELGRPRPIHSRDSTTEARDRGPRGSSPTDYVSGSGPATSSSTSGCSAGSRPDDDLRDVMAEISDRYGPIPGRRRACSASSWGSRRYRAGRRPRWRSRSAPPRVRGRALPDGQPDRPGAPLLRRRAGASCRERAVSRSPRTPRSGRSGRSAAGLVGRRLAPCYLKPVCEDLGFSRSPVVFAVLGVAGRSGRSTTLWPPAARSARSPRPAAVPGAPARPAAVRRSRPQGNRGSWRAGRSPKIDDGHDHASGRGSRSVTQPPVAVHPGRAYTSLEQEEGSSSTR